MRVGPGQSCSRSKHTIFSQGYPAYGLWFRSSAIGVLFGCFGRKIDGDSGFTWWFHHLPGKPIYLPKRTPMSSAVSSDCLPMAKNGLRVRLQEEGDLILTVLQYDLPP